MVAPRNWDSTVKIVTDIADADETVFLDPESVAALPVMPFVGNLSALTADAASNSSNVQAAMNAASTAGGGVVLLPAGSYPFSVALVPKTKVQLRGFGKWVTTLYSTVNGNVINNGANGFTDFTIEDIGFTGTVNQTVTVPTRARTTSGAGTTTAVYIDASLDPNGGSHPLCTNFEMVNCRVANCSSLPIRLFGISGTTRVADCDFYNNQDVGFGFNAEVMCVDNHVLMSADNGISISRGNIKVTCTGNTVENCAYSGIWLSGFSGDVGPREFSCVGNTIRMVGQSGIMLQTSPKFGTVVGNHITQGGFRGPVDGADDLTCCGIYVESGVGLNISANTIFNAPRAGILGKTLTGCNIAANLLYNIGTHFLADGSTAIAASSVTQNVGILLDTSTTFADTVVKHNVIVDERGAGSNWLNWGLVPATATPGITAGGNIVNGGRNPSNLPDDVDLTRKWIKAPAGWNTVWKSARAAQATTPAIVAFVGDSIVQGAFASVNSTKSWVALIRASILAQAGNTLYGDYWNPYQWSSGLGGATVSPYGAPTGATTHEAGLGRSIGPGSNLSAAFQTFTSPYAVGSMDFLFMDYASGTFEFLIDGGQGTGTPVVTGATWSGTRYVYTSTNASSVVNSTLKKITITGLSNATHTIQYGWQSAANTLIMAGINTYAYGATGGLFFTWVGMGGANAVDFATWRGATNGLGGTRISLPSDKIALFSNHTSNLNTAWTPTGIPFPPSLMFLSLGTNDCTNSTPLGAYGRAMTRFIQAARRGVDNASIIGVIPNYPDGITSDVDPVGRGLHFWRYKGQARRIFDAYNCATVDIDAKWGENGLADAFLVAANLHPTDAGYQDIADILTPLVNA